MLKFVMQPRKWLNEQNVRLGKTRRSGLGEITMICSQIDCPSDRGQMQMINPYNEFIISTAIVERHSEQSLRQERKAFKIKIPERGTRAEIYFSLLENLHDCCELSRVD